MAGCEEPRWPDPEKCRSRKRVLGRKRHGGAPRGGVPVSWDAPRLASAASRLTSATNKVVRLPALRRPPHFGVGAAADAKDYGASPPKRRQRQRRWVETKRDGRTNPGAKTRRGNETGCVDKPRGGLFDIVKRERGAAHAEGGLCICAWPLTHIWKPRIAAQAPVSLGCTGGGRPGAKSVRTQSRFRSRYLLGRMVSSKACKFRDHAPAGTTAMTNAESDEKRRTPCHAAARSCASNRQSPGHARAYGTRRATL